jgi:hypothetical protein
MICALEPGNWLDWPAAGWRLPARLSAVMPRGISRQATNAVRPAHGADAGDALVVVGAGERVQAHFQRGSEHLDLSVAQADEHAILEFVD